jgi:hypothetical protein
MGNRKKLPLFVLNGVRKGPMISLVGRLSIVAAVYVFVVTIILLVQTNMLTSHVSPTVFGILALWIVVPVGVSYLYWRPRYRAF